MNGEDKPSYEFKMDIENNKVIETVIFKNFTTDNECKFCFEKNNLIFPCACHNGVHEKCLKKWLKMKRHNNPNKCEICLKNYNFNYIVIRNRSPRNRQLRGRNLENTIVPIRNNSRFVRKYIHVKNYVQVFLGLGISIILIFLSAYLASCLDTKCNYIFIYTSGGMSIIILPILIMDRIMICLYYY